MKNFTNNFKQFTSRLSARWLIMALMMLVGTSSVWGKVIYLDVSKAFDNGNGWFSADAKFQAWVWGGSSADAWYTPIKGDVYYEFTIPDDRTGMKMYRRGPSQNNNEHNNNHWNTTGDLTIPTDGKNLFTITSWGGGEWSTYDPPANAGFWEADAWNIKYYPGSGNDKWIDDNIYGHIEANGTAELGTLTGRPYLKGILANVYWTQDVSDVCGLEVTFKDADNTTQSITTFTWRDIDGDNIDKELKTESLNIPLPYSSGDHTVTFTFTASINNNGTGNCTETTTMTGTITYEIPECSVPDGITIQYADGEKFCVNSNVTLSPSVAHEDGYTYAWVVSGTGWSINSGSAARECEVKVGTGVGSVTLTVSNATCSKEANTLNITPTASTPIATPTISATKQIICNGNNDSFLSVGNPKNGATYTLEFEGSEQTDPAPIPYSGSGDVKFAISKAGSYTVVAKTTDTEACQYTARATDEIDFTSISFSQSEYTTTPWVPVSVVVNAPEGTTYEYDDTAITGSTALKEAPIKTISNNTYTYKLPRPTEWGEGNKTPANEEVNFTVSAEITVDAETCNIQSTVKLQDEGNDNCTTNP